MRVSAAELWILSEHGCHSLQCVYSSLCPSLRAQLSLWASLEHPEAPEQTQRSAKPTNKPTHAVCSLYLHIWEWLHSLPFRKLSQNFFQETMAACKCQPVELQQLIRISIPPLNILKILPSFLILSHALLNTCHSPWCKQEHFRDLRTPCTYRNLHWLSIKETRCVGYITDVWVTLHTEAMEGGENKAEIIQNLLLLSKKVLNGSQNHFLLLNIIYFLLISILRAGEESFFLEFFISGFYPHRQLLEVFTPFCKAVVVYPL